MGNKSPWVGHWWSYKNADYVAVVKQDGELDSPTCYNKDKAETTWIFFKGACTDNHVTFHAPGNFKISMSIPVEDIPFPPVDYIDMGAHEFELTENSYILYD